MDQQNKVKGTVETKHNRGSKTSKATFVKKHPFAIARDLIKELELKVSENTVRRRLDIAGLFSYRAA